MLRRVLAGSLVAAALLVAVPASAVVGPPKSFNLWVGKWMTPYGVLTLKPTTAAVPPDTRKRPALSGTFSKGGTLLGRLNANRGDAGDLSNTNIVGNYRIPNAGSGQFGIAIHTSEGSTTAFRAFQFNAFGGRAATFTAPYLGDGPSVADLERSFVAAQPVAHPGGTLYTVRWHYKAKLIGPSALPRPGLLLKFRYSRPISPLHYALGPPGAGFVQHIWGCGEVRNAARTTKLGFDCETFSLGPRHDVGTGWLVDATFSATVPAGSPPISATISNTASDKFAHLPTEDRTVLHAGRSIPKGPGSGAAFSWTGTWSWTATVRGRVFREQGMSIVQQGLTACSRSCAPATPAGCWVGSRR